MKRTLIAAVSGIALSLACLAGAANAQDITTWQPTTAAGGARVDPSYWDNRAAVRFNGGVGSQSNVTFATNHSTTTVYDYSQTSVEGGQTIVNTTAVLENGGTYTVNTHRGDNVFNDDSEMNNSTTNISVNATMGDGSELETNTSVNGDPGG